jgi:hypothetical protein
MLQQTSWIRVGRITLCITTAIASTSALAQLPVDQPSASATEEPAPTKTDRMIESTSQTVRSTVEWLARGIDRRFGDKPFADGGTVTDGQVRLSVLKRDGQSSDYNLRFNARVRLPNLSTIPYLFVGNDDERNVVTDQPDHQTLKDQIRQRTTTKNSFFVGVGLWLADSVDVRIGFRGPLKPYTQARLRHEWQLTPDDVIEARETIFYTINDRAGSTTAVEYQHAVRSTTAIRWLNSGTITQHNPNMAFSSILGLYESFGEQRVLGFELQYSDSKVADIATNDIGLQLSWEQPLHKMVLGEVTLGHYWPRSTTAPDRTGQWALGATVGLKF